MSSFLKRNLPVFIIGILTLSGFLWIIFQGSSRKADENELPQLVVVTNDDTSTVRDGDDVLPPAPEPAPEVIQEEVRFIPKNALTPEEADERLGIVQITFTNEGFEPVEALAELNQLVRWTNTTDEEIVLYQTTYKKYPEWDRDVAISPGGTFEFRFYKEKLWTYKERASGEFGSVYVNRISY